LAIPVKQARGAARGLKSGRAIKNTESTTARPAEIHQARGFKKSSFPPPRSIARAPTPACAAHAGRPNQNKNPGTAQAVPGQFMPRPLP
jgi:hypothetical protein